MNDHIPDATKMIQDTPRMQSALLDHPDAGFAKIWQVGCDIERELTTAQDRIKRLEAAGDAMINEEWNKPRHVEQWRKAKEAKP
jgi:hypothetical protein